MVMGLLGSETEDGFVVMDSVTKYFGRFQALDGVSLEIRKGDIFGYIGPNGAGKTTTIKIIVGLIRSFEGTVRFKGRSIRDNWGIMHRELGYLPQHASFQEWRTVDHALRTFGQLSGLSGAELETRIKYVLERIAISDMREKKIAQLSGGTIQKLGMAQAILHDPEILVLDEPMAGLDPKSRFEFKEIFKELSRQGTTIFFSSHILSDVQDLANRIGILNGGRITHIGTAADLEEKLRLPKQIDVVLSKDSGQWKERLSIEGIEEVRQPAQFNIAIRLEKGADVDMITDQVIKALLAAGCKIRKISPETPTLEELYMRYLGGAEEQ